MLIGSLPTLKSLSTSLHQTSNISIYHLRLTIHKLFISTHLNVATPLTKSPTSNRRDVRLASKTFLKKMIPHDVCQAQFDDWRSLMTVSECPQCVPPEKLSMQCQHRRVSRDQEDSGDSLRDLWGEVSSPLLARFGRFKSRRGQSSKTAAWNRELLSLALTGSSFSDSFSTLFKYSPLRNWGRAESSLNKLKQYSSSYLTKSQCCTLGQSSDILIPRLYISWTLELEKILLCSASWQGGAPSLCWCPPRSRYIIEKEIVTNRSQSHFYGLAFFDILVSIIYVTRQENIKGGCYEGESAFVKLM